MAERLPLCEASFRALEDAYEKQWEQAHLLQQQQQQQRQPASDGRTKGARTTHSAGVAAAEMRRLLSLTRQLHRRFVAVCDGTGPLFSAEEQQGLLVLGFNTAEVPPRRSLVPPAVCPAAKEKETALRDTHRKEEDTTALREENAQLLSALAWYRFREGATQSNAIATAETGSSSSPQSAATVLEQLRALEAVNADLCRSSNCATGGGAGQPCPCPADGQQRAVDVAIGDVLKAYNFPRAVRVERVASSRLYQIDRTVEIDFASPQSCTLVVRDPEAAEEDTDLRAYLLSLYGPLLRALRWRPPAGVEVEDALLPPLPDSFHAEGRAASHRLNSDAEGILVSADAANRHALSTTRPRSATEPAVTSLLVLGNAQLSQLSYEDLLALKRATLQRLGHPSSGGAS